jgi:hypothetical protein
VNRTDGHPDGCPTEGGRAPDGGGQLPDGEREWPDGGCDGCLTEGGVSGGGSTEKYKNGGGPQFWPLSSSTQSHLLELYPLFF